MSAPAPSRDGAFHPVLRERLESPALTLDCAGLARLWKEARIEAVCAPPPLLEDGPWLAGAVRGALGRRLLMMMERADGASVDGAPSALHALFRPQGMVGPGLEIPKPFVLTAERRGNRMVVTLVLFGFAVFWEPSARLALAEALDAGLPLRSGGRHRAPWRLESLSAIWRTGIDVPGSESRIRIQLLTPLALRRGRSLIGDLNGFTEAVLRRLAGLAPWQDATLDAKNVRVQARALRIVDLDVQPVIWSRRSGLQDGRLIPVAGLTGSFALEGGSGSLAPALALATATHVGHGPSLGMGRVAVSPA